MNDSALASKPVEDLLDLLIRSLGLDLVYRFVSPRDKSTDAAPQPASRVDLRVELSGPDASLLTAHNGELLHAIEHIAAKILNLESEDHDRISLDADGFKQNRDENLSLAAETAVAQVQSTGQPYAFPPMTSRERRMLHLALQDSGLPTASSGDGPRRFVVLYPMGAVPKPTAATMAAVPDAVATPSRARNIRSAFRPR